MSGEYLPMLQESCTFSRRKDHPGVEVRRVENTSRTWRCYSTDFEFMAPDSWVANVAYRGETFKVEPGKLFCSHPSEVFAAKEVLEMGSGSSLTIEPSILFGHFDELGIERERVRFRALVELNESLSIAIRAVFETIDPQVSLLEFETRLVEFLECASRELLEEVPPRLESKGSRGLAERIRQSLNEDGGAVVDLSTLAQIAGCSRFQALRAFQKEYGLPPHAYQLRVRLGLAQRMLKRGCSPAQVAAELGFVDQSHLTRHFKRLMNITPAQYARIGGS
jgi:AraC-like DNA-binding protein